MSTKPKKDQIISFAKSQGFDLIGFAQVAPSKKAYKHYLNWLDKKFNAEMQYMDRKDAVEKRKSAKKILKEAKTIICLATNYYHEQSPLPEGHGRIARYAYGRDYHKSLRARLRAMEDYLKPHKAISYTDTGPLLERTLAEEAGLGYIGKNSCLITKEFGSWVFLAEIITDLEIEKTPFPTGLSCGSCTRCINACPTKAIIKNPETGQYFIDANKCISYLTIEHKGPIPKSLAKKINQTKRLYGCDICQEVCPHNCRAQPTKHKFLTDPEIAGNALNLKEIKDIKTDKDFLEKFAGSPLMRAKKEGLQRNAKIMG